MQSFKQLAAEAARVVNSTLGVPCTYYPYDDVANPVTLNVTIDKNSQVKDQMGNVLGYEVIASFEKSELPRRPAQRDYFDDDEGTRWHIHQMREETKAKWYFTVEGR